ncbi:10468_t:CDS:2 [Paraglomus occultum]|uniref:10468_t:CDS:1 n=1 Tax=Paraglomus occultum TaxID=144539 RepID=A0A9N8WE90_9GLOM|nr:10468_t:CDS:2 [Paraglomus occultum]
MSFNISFPSVEEVRKWSPKHVITFLEAKKEELFLDDEDISSIIRTNKVAGRPAETIVDIIREIKGEPEASIIVNYGV